MPLGSGGALSSVPSAKELRSWALRVAPQLWNTFALEAKLAPSLLFSEICYDGTISTNLFLGMCHPEEVGIVVKVLSFFSIWSFVFVFCLFYMHL